MKRRSWLAGVAALAGLGGCADAPPLRLGLLAGLSGRGACNSEDGRNGAMLAVEQCNAAGGVAGRPLELLVRDAGGDAASTLAALRELLALSVRGVIGPYTTAPTLAVLSQAQPDDLLLLSPSATAPVLVGQDDALLMLGPAAARCASACAALLWQRGQRRLALAFANEGGVTGYAAGWSAAFASAFEARGGVLVHTQPFAADARTAYAGIVHRLLEPAPDGLVLACSSVDAVRLMQHVRRRTNGLAVALSESAGGENLLALGGRLLDGVVVGQLHNRFDRSLAYLRFVEAFQRRFGRGPGAYALYSHDAVTVLLQSHVRRQGGESWKQAVLARGPYAGLQQPLLFDRFGDNLRAPHFVVVRDGQFAPLT